jgi:hypothetical protein
VDRVGAANRGRRRLGEAEVASLALLHEKRHGTDGLLDGYGRVDAMLIVEIHMINAEALQAGLARGCHILRPAVDVCCPVWVADVAELRREDDLIAPVGDRPADQLLVVAVAVHVGGVQKVDADTDGPVKRRNGFGFVRIAVHGAHAHASEADGRHLQPAPPQLSSLHGSSSGERP